MKNNRPEVDLEDEAIRTFWRWFLDHHLDIEAMLDRDDTDDELILIQKINAQIKALSPKIAWEIGPGIVKPYMLVFPTSGGDESKTAVSRIMEEAPTIEGWEYHCSLPARPFPPEIQLLERGVTIRTSDWRFLLERSPGSDRFDLQVMSDELASFDERTALTAVFILLDTVLGEAMVERWIGDIRVSMESQKGQPMLEIAGRLAELVG